MGRGSMVGQIDDVRNLAGFFERADDANGLSGDSLLRLIGRSADVMRAVNVRQRYDLVVEVAGRPFRLICEDVQPDADAFGLDGAFQRALIDYLGARRVDQV